MYDMFEHVICKTLSDKHHHPDTVSDRAFDAWTRRLHSFAVSSCAADHTKSRCVFLRLKICLRAFLGEVVYTSIR